MAFPWEIPIVITNYNIPPLKNYDPWLMKPIPTCFSGSLLVVIIIPRFGSTDFCSVTPLYRVRFAFLFTSKSRLRLPLVDSLISYVNQSPVLLSFRALEICFFNSPFFFIRLLSIFSLFIFIFNFNFTSTLLMSDLCEL